MCFSKNQAGDLQQQAYQYLVEGNYTQATTLYEEIIEVEPQVKSHYWYLGLVLLLQGQEAEAQTTWLFAMTEGEAEEVEQWTTELIQVLTTEAQRQESLEDFAVAWAIRQHIREILPVDIENLLHLIQLSIKIGNYTGEELISFGVLELLQSEPPIEVNQEQLMRVLQDVLHDAPDHSQTLEFIEVCLPYVPDNQKFIDILLETAFRVASIQGNTALAAKITEFGLRLEPHHLKLLPNVASFHQNAGNDSRGIELAELYLSLVDNLAKKAFASHLFLRGLMHAGSKYIKKANAFLQEHETLLKSLIESDPTELDQGTTIRLFSTYFYFPYFRDLPQENLALRHQISQVCQKNIEGYASEKTEKYHQKILSRQSLEISDRPLKIGYLSNCLRVHSVGWLTRWLWQHHNRDKFQIYAYLVSSKGREDPLQSWYINQADKAYEFPMEASDIAEHISEDEVDILVDLDSITFDMCCEIMAVKSAPVQVTWLGWDVSGVPAIDYFIADPYVLPEDAQEYYREKIWRLPQTYIAVDGFEVATPTIRRDDLNIPSDAIVYLSSQTGYKYNLQTARLQMQIIKEVPNSYFLIKDLTSREFLKNFFTQLAEEEGINPDRLKFLPGVPLATHHRANLAIADVVLDTFPYNGATTTLETLWMGIPMVTRVGQQFASRNSYTMMVNAGINEGIAWTDEEYVEWGIRLGTDEALRQQVAWKLRKSKQTAPLWNGKQFTREMEKAYQQMWQIYLDSRG